MKKIDAYLLGKTQGISDWLHNHFHTDNFKISRMFFLLSLLPLYAKFVFEASHLPQSFPVIMLLFLVCLMLQACIIAANNGARLELGGITYVEIPILPHFLFLDRLRLYALAFMCITTFLFILELCLWKFSISLTEGIPENVLHTGINVMQSFLLSAGIFFLSCQKRRKRFTNYTLFAH